MEEIIINVAKDFTKTPGARYRDDGEFSGQEFREDFLMPHFKNDAEVRLKIILDGVIGYATSFLEEAFGGLAREIGKEKCLKSVELVSNEDELLVEEIREYIQDV